MNTPIDTLRSEITVLDREIIALLGKRFTCVQEIGMIKAREGTAIIDSTREAELSIVHRNAAREYGVSEEFVAILFSLIIDESKRLQQL